MATSIASQLKAIKSAVRGSSDTARRSNTAPSVVFDPKAAADIDLRTILPISRSGLEVLTGIDPRLGRYADTLFSPASLEMNKRERWLPADEEKLNGSIVSFLRLLAGNLHQPSALQALEYLIRRYEVHVYNTEELILCALPYHDTHLFVRIVQLLDLGNNKWAFLEGVKESGAPPPRKVIVQQCIRDKGVLETLCNYASPMKEFQHPRPVICFCTAVIVEALGSLQKLDNDMVQRILPFVFNGLKMKESQDHKAGSLMVVGLLATKATLASKLVQSLMFCIAKLALDDARKSADLPWLRVATMALISLAQSQSINLISKKTLLVLNDIRDFVGIISGLSMEFNIHNFFGLYLDMLIEYSIDDESFILAISNAMMFLPVKDFIDRMVSKVLSYCIKKLRNTDGLNLDQTGVWLRQILAIIDKHHPSELRVAVHKYLESSLANCRGESTWTMISQILDSNLDMPIGISDSKILFSLQHPKASIRRSALFIIATSGFIKDTEASAEEFKKVCFADAILSGLRDIDLTVVGAALSIEGLPAIIEISSLFFAFRDVLSKCLGLITKGSNHFSQALDVAISCLQHLAFDFQSLPSNYSEEIATLMFPLLVVLPKTWKINLKALELHKHVNWPLFLDSAIEYESAYFEQIKGMHASHFASINMKLVRALAETFLKDPQSHMQWFIECSRSSGISRSLFLLILLQAFINFDQVATPASLFKLYGACSEFLKHEWSGVESRHSVVYSDERNIEELNKALIGFIEQLFNADFESFVTEILISIFWGILKVYDSLVRQITLVDIDDLLPILEDLFIFFMSSSSRTIFQKHLHFMATNCIKFPSKFLSKYITEASFSNEVQTGSLLFFASLCDRNVLKNDFPQLLFVFPSLLIRLCSEIKDVRASAVKCVEALCRFLRSLELSKLRNGCDTVVAQTIFSPVFFDFLESLIMQKKLITSDIKFLPAFIASVLGPASNNVSVPANIYEFNQAAKNAILYFILDSSLKFSSYGKLCIFSLLKGMGKVILVKEVVLLMSELLTRRMEHHFEAGRSQNCLSNTEVKTLCLLLEVSLCGPSYTDANIPVYLLDALQVSESCLEDPAIVEPCVTVMQKLTSLFYGNLDPATQENFFINLVVLFRSNKDIIQNAAKGAVLQIDIDSSTIIKFLGILFSGDHNNGSPKRKKVKNCVAYSSYKGKSTLFLLNSLLDILLLKKDVKRREHLIVSLFEILEKLFSNDCILHSICPDEEKNLVISKDSAPASDDVCYAQQATLLLLKDLIDCLLLELSSKDNILNKSHVELLIECARSAKNESTQCHVFMLLSSLVKITPGWVSDHIIDIFIIIGETAVKQNDSHCQQVLEDLISQLVPCWLSKIDNIENLLQIFIITLPEIAEHRKLAVIVCLLRTLGEERSLGLFLLHLFRSLISRKYKPDELKMILNNQTYSAVIVEEWEYLFAVQLCRHYSCKVWFPSLVKLLEQISVHNEHAEHFIVLLLSMEFIVNQLHDTELVFQLESSQETDLQGTLAQLMERVVLCWQLATAGSKHISIMVDLLKELEMCANRILKATTRWILPALFFHVIINLLDYLDATVQRKGLRILCDVFKDHSSVQKKATKAKTRKKKPISLLVNLNEEGRESFSEMCLKICHLIDSASEKSEISVKLSALLSIEVLAKVFVHDAVYTKCLECIVKHINSANQDISARCLRTIASLITVLGSKSLKQIPDVMNSLKKKFHHISICPYGKSGIGSPETFEGSLTSKSSFLMSVLITFEAFLTYTSKFLNPYLKDILSLLLLYPGFTLEIDQKIYLKAISARKLLALNFPTRLLLTQVLNMYPDALKCGESSLLLLFEVLENMVDAMDRPSIVSCYIKVYEQCLFSLDLRHQNVGSIKNVASVELHIIHVIIVLSLKLTEAMFKPLFLQSLDWADCEIEDTDTSKRRSIDRAISFYTLVNKLVENHRSLFVPYFKYLLDGCTRHLTEVYEVEVIAFARNRKKQKVGNVHNVKDSHCLGPKQWHLRALVFMSLYRCFLYDAAEHKFLDSCNFQVLLKPLVSQLAMEPPSSLHLLPELPNVEEVDKSLILCIGQMAVTAHSDVLLKPLIHEVLMQTRSEKMRPKILGLKIIKYLLEHLKEEYMIFLAETTHFLAELLEDADPTVKSLTQEILKELELVSGESLQEYL